MTLPRTLAIDRADAKCKPPQHQGRWAPRWISTIVILGLSALTACSSTPATMSPARTESAANLTGATSGDGSAGAAAATRWAGDRRGASNDGASLRGTRIYFDFDRSEIKPEYAALITDYARWLVSDKHRRLRLEGNTDERGSPEYNVGLGERRATSVRQALLLQGALESQLTTVSFGEEHPVAEGHGEDAWSQNRRVDFVTLAGQ